jgi:hypothetical protein
MRKQATAVDAEMLVTQARAVVRACVARLPLEAQAGIVSRLDADAEPGCEPFTAVKIELRDSRWTLTVGICGSKPTTIASVSGVLALAA